MTATLLALAVVVIGTAGLIWLLVVMVGGHWWPSLLLQTIHRRRSMITCFVVTALAFVLLCALIMPPNAALAAGICLWFWMAPAIAATACAWWAWRGNTVDLRTRAADVRNRRNERLEISARVGYDRWWMTYIIDAELAKRQASYRPPGGQL